MRRQDNRQVLITLGMSFLTLCVINQCHGLMLTGLESLFLFVIFSGLILFVVNRSSVLQEMAIACVFRLTGLAFADATAWQFLGRADREAFQVDEPPLPFRFQRPPPAFSV